jgi:hypothetical protein
MASEAAWLTAEKQGLAAVLLQSHQRAFSRPLIASAQPGQLKAAALPEPVRLRLSGAGPRQRSRIPSSVTPTLQALQLWESRWDELIGMPSRLTAPNSERAERSNALGQAKRLDAVQNYRGIRISRKGRRFMINKARIWTLWDAEERVCGQAACFSDWWWL